MFNFKDCRRQIGSYLSPEFCILSYGKLKKKPAVQIPIFDDHNTRRRHLTQLCPVISNLIGDNKFKCRLNLVKLQRWLQYNSMFSLEVAHDVTHHGG